MANSSTAAHTHEDGVRRLLGARLNRERERLVLVLDTLSLARRHGDRMELAAINTGSTIRRPARRGRSTFTPLHLQPFYRAELGYGPGDFPVTERVAARTLALPWSATLSDDDVAYVAEVLADSVRVQAGA